MAINLDIFVSDIAAALGSFDVIEVQRSVTDELGPFEFLTKASPASAASITGTIAGPFAVVGTTLSFKLDSSPQVDVTFTGTNPLTTTQAVDQINAAVGATVAFDDANQLRLTSTLLGTQSKLEILNGSAAAILGFTPGDRVIGLEARVVLAAGVSSYPFTDNDGQAGYLYRVRFLKESTGQASEWSAPFEGAVGTQISSANLALATVDLVDPGGVARAGQTISFFSLHQPLTVEGFAVGVGRSPIRMTTDTAGHAEVNLVRGMKMRVVFEGTSLIRDFVVPDQATFDILGAIATAPDIWNISEQELPAAPRRTL